jgi:hypothetical protein
MAYTLHRTCKNKRWSSIIFTCIVAQTLCARRCCVLQSKQPPDMHVPFCRSKGFQYVLNVALDLQEQAVVLLCFELL